MKIGYARVSTLEQNLDLQIDALKKSGCTHIFEEKASGKNSNRPELQLCIKSLRPDDVLVVWRMDRLGRSLKDLISIVSSLESNKIGFESITEKIDTTSATGKLVFHFFGAMAEFERNLTRERTIAGLSAARARGRVGGRKPALTESDMQIARAMLADKSITVSEVARRLKVGRTTIYKYFPGGKLNETHLPQQKQPISNITI